MQKVSQPFQRKDHAGWWIRYQDPNTKKRRMESFHTKALAETYRFEQYQRLNHHVYKSAIVIPWESAKAKYLEYIKIRVKKPTYKISVLVLSRLEQVCCLEKSTDLTQELIDLYIQKRHAVVSNPYTLNKDIQRLLTFIKWLKKKKYLTAEIEVEKFSTPEPVKKALYDDKIIELLKSCPSRQWQLKIILFIVTGLRKNDLYKLPRLAVNLSEAWVDTSQFKTGKAYSGPIPEAMVDELKEYSASLPAKRTYFWQKVNQKKLDEQFRDFRPFHVTIQGLRKTYSTRIETTGISTLSMSHSSAAVTRKFYTDMDFIRHARVNQLPVAEWLAVPFTPPPPHVNNGRRGNKKP